MLAPVPKVLSVAALSSPMHDFEGWCITSDVSLALHYSCRIVQG